MSNSESWQQPVDIIHSLNIRILYSNMRFMSFATLALFGVSVNAVALDTTVRRQTNITDKPTCGTTADATLSDCRAIFDDWPSFPNWEPTCHYGVEKAWRRACFGNFA
jgi:hypothetical protein